MDYLKIHVNTKGELVHIDSQGTQTNIQGLLSELTWWFYVKL